MKDTVQKVLLLDARTGFYKINRYKVGDFYGPIDLGLFYSGRYNSLNIGTGLLAGSIFPGSNRLIFSGFSPCWGGYYVSSMGGAALIFDNLGINMLSIIGKAQAPSILILNRNHGEEIDVQIEAVDLNQVWSSGRKGMYGMMDHAYEKFGANYSNTPRILSTGPASASTDFGGIASAPIKRGQISDVDTWAGRGGFGTKMLQEHNIAAVIYGGTVIDEDFRDRKVADEWFQDKYQKKMAAKDIEATTKYRFDPNFETGGTFGVNYATLGGRVIAFNYSSLEWSEEERLKMHEDLIVGHYLKQFNEETIAKKQQFNCGEPCVAVCKKMNNQFKKDYEPYQTMGPLCGIFDQRAAERVTHHADMLGFDAISVGGVISWLMECLDKKLLTPQELGVSELPKFNLDNFDVVNDSAKNAQIAIELLDAINEKKGLLDLSEGARKFGRRLSRKKNVNLLDYFVFNSFGRKGWMVPNQYWSPGVLSPMPIMGKYYNNYGNEFIPPRELGRRNADRMNKELILDNLGFCRFHRQWAEEMMPEVMGKLFGQEEGFLENISFTASRINSRNASVFWESERNFDLIHSFIRRQKEIYGVQGKEIDYWLDYFGRDKKLAALDYWYEIHKGVHETLREF
jgi:glyceraldehyde-3-phosphate dehydrogenase (ferredoxin)